MDFKTHLHEAFLNLVTSKLRSFLAILGVLVGTCSVVALISSSQLATSHALDQFKTLGTNLLAMSIQDSQQAAVQSNAQSQQLKLDDMPKLISASPEILLAAPYTSVYQSLVFNGQQLSGQILGATGALSDIAKIDVSRGRFISVLDKNNFYCVIGATIAQTIQAQGIDPLYKQIQVGDFYFTVVGIAETWPSNLFIYADINNSIIIPIQASYLLSKQTEIQNVLFRLVKSPDLQAVQSALSARATELLPDKEIDYRNPEQIISIVNKQRATFTWLLGAIGGISLLVGGIGVMNIMLVSVVERRREIGIRKAIGAKRIDILIMFLIEAVMLTIFGGLMGIIVGVGISFILAKLTGWEFYLYLLPPLLGFVVSVLVGIISGFYPALRASRLDPMKTLQSD